MTERRKIKDRRVNPPRQGLPLYYQRYTGDRRLSVQAAQWNPWEGTEADRTTRRLIRGRRNMTPRFGAALLGTVVAGLRVTRMGIAEALRAS